MTVVTTLVSTDVAARMDGSVEAGSGATSARRIGGVDVTFERGQSTGVKVPVGMRTSSWLQDMAGLNNLDEDDPDVRRLLTAVAHVASELRRFSLRCIADLRPGDRDSVAGQPAPAAQGAGPLLMLLVERDQLARGQHSDYAIGPSSGDRAAYRFVHTGEVWSLTFDGETVHLKDAKGLRDIAELLRHPNREVHCLELMGSTVHESDRGPVIDSTARRAYQRRARELQIELDDAETVHDLERADSARSELEMLVDQLTAATGLGGRRRRVGASAERARSAVRWRIRAALRRIAAAHPALGRHLERAIRTGTYCAYQPAEPVDWQM